MTSQKGHAMLETSTERQDKITVIKVLGRIDHSNVSELEVAINREFQAGIYNVAIDLSLLDVVFSIAIGVMWANCQKARAKGGDLVFLGVQSGIQNILETLGIDTELRQFRSMEEVTSYFALPVDQRGH